MVKVDEVTVAPNPSIAFEVPVTKPSLSVEAIQLLINLEEELVAINTEEEPEDAVNPFAF